MKGAIRKAEELAAQFSDSFIPQQFINPTDMEVHRRTTAQKILRDYDGRVDIFVAGVGTGGTVTDVGSALKEHDPWIVAVEPYGFCPADGPPPTKFRASAQALCPRGLTPM